MKQIKANSAINNEIAAVKKATGGLKRGKANFGKTHFKITVFSKLPAAEAYMDDHLALTRAVSELRQMIVADMEHLESSVEVIKQADAEIGKQIKV